ncbi:MULTISPECIES: MltA domain-containing protein [unclassified Brevundimonas]|uniref:MltA domain-containing protein n=1 Tax=unclassified Brevundimonas TaxID=2622653 RepID=UPI0025C4DAF9|nr:MULTISPECIES: MltA domain-containing protein [unclassified Brevundimonas]
MRSVAGNGLNSAGRGFAGLALVLLAAACASSPKVPTLPYPGQPNVPPVNYPPANVPPQTGPVPYPGPQPYGQPLTQLPGWEYEDHQGALRAYAEGCGVLRTPYQACQNAKSMMSRYPHPSAETARAFFEQWFVAVEVRNDDGSNGLLTSYFAPEYPARWIPDSEFDMPVLSRPANLASVGDRRAIEAGSAQSQALAWMRAEDLFFLQIQGSGNLTFPDGRRMRAAYAADNGQRFVGIARPMAERGLLPQNGTSGDAIRGWLARNRGPLAREVMQLNPRYIFFTLAPDDGREAVGAANIPLHARRSIAVDPSKWSYGEAVWIEGDGGNLRGARGSYRGLMMALDTGSAIRGQVRADLYMGTGDAAGAEAGTVRHPLRMWRLMPRQ